MRVSIQDRINQQVAGRLYGYTGDDNSSEEEDADDYNYDDDQVTELIKTDWFESLSKQIDDLSTKNKQLEAKNKRLSSTTEPNDSDLQFALTPDGILQAGLCIAPDCKRINTQGELIGSKVISVLHLLPLLHSFKISKRSILICTSRIV